MIAGTEMVSEQEPTTGIRGERVGKETTESCPTI